VYVFCGTTGVCSLLCSGASIRATAWPIVDGMA
jgi:hypothetical protein